MEKITLSNGFRVWLDPVDTVRSASMGIWVGSGSRYENKENAGVSHFIEHMLFKGTHKRSALDIAEQMDEIGGAVNAFTTKEYTCFYARALDYHVNTAFEILCDMLTNSKLSQSDVETERGVILEEIGMYEDSPEDVCADELHAGVWEGNMLASNILGTRGNIKKMTADDLRSYMNEMYVPERMVASFSGKFDRDEVLAMCEKYFGSLKNTSNTVSAEPAQYRSCLRLKRKSFEQTQLSLALPGVPSQDERRYIMRVLLSILGGSSSSRLFQRMREELGLVYNIDAFGASYLNTGIIGIDMALSPSNEKKALNETFRIIREFSDTVTEREVRRAREQGISGLVMSWESTQSRAAKMGCGELLYNKVYTQDEIIASLQAVTLDDVRILSEEFLNIDKLSLSAAGKVKPSKFYRDIVTKAQSMVK